MIKKKRKTETKRIQEVWKDLCKTDYRIWLQRPNWTYKIKDWWESELVLLSCGIDPNKTPVVRVLDILEYAGRSFYRDDRLAAAEARNPLIEAAIMCGELGIMNNEPPDYTDLE